ncbi:unnamed protein product, partial [Ixodes persulcatus]
VGPGAALLAPARTLADIDGLGGGRRSEAGAALAGSPGDEPPRSNMELVRRSKNFSVAESDALISLWSDPETQKKFDSAYRHSVIWEMIANKLRMHGYDRSSIDCKTKINNLKATYFKFRRIYSAGECRGCGRPHPSCSCGGASEDGPALARVCGIDNTPRAGGPMF